MKGNGAIVLIVIALAVIFADGEWEGHKGANKNSTSNSAPVSTAGLDGRDQSKGRATLVTARPYDGPGKPEPVAVRRDGECQYQNEVVKVPLSSERYPASTWHIKLAWRRGAPKVWHLDRSGADANREQSLKGIESNSKLDRDEVPIAASEEGGAGADIAYIPFSDNRGSGSSIGNALSDYCDGQAFRVVITK
jgi:hypothetical protein